MDTGPRGIRSARAREPLDSRRPEVAHDQGSNQLSGEVSRGVPAFRPVDTARVWSTVLRTLSRVAVYGAHAQVPSGGRRFGPRRRPYGWHWAATDCEARLES